MSFKVTIITVVRNAENLLPALFSSVRNVKTPDVEFIVLDGASTDGTVAVITQNTDIIDTWLSEPDKGIYDAMNKAVNMAKGQWLIFIGADDKLQEGFKQSIPLLKQPEIVYYGKVLFHDTFITGPIKDNYTLTKTNICHQAIFYPKAVFEKYQYQTEYVVCADYVLNLSLWNDPDFKFKYIDTLVANFPKGGFSSNTSDPLFERDKEALFKKHLGVYALFRYIKRNKGYGAAFKKLFGNG
jgi:glycosyltransferase involved in cell wall biosynthesis